MPSDVPWTHGGPGWTHGCLGWTQGCLGWTHGCPARIPSTEVQIENTTPCTQIFDIKI